MSDTPDVSRRRRQGLDPSSGAEPSSSPQDTPTVEFRGKAGKTNPHAIDAPPTDDPSCISPAGLAAPSPLAVDIPPELANHPRYRIVGMLGKGGMGIVYRAEHRVMKRDVALKVIAAHLVA
jgi:hypothetical protein